MQIVAVLSTTVLPYDGVYEVRRIKNIPDLHGVPHYIGHPATRAIVEYFGAVPAATNLFDGLRPGESAITFAIKQGKSTRREQGFTTPHQDVTLDDLDVRIITRLDGQWFCQYCGHDTLGARFCPMCGMDSLR